MKRPFKPFVYSQQKQDIQRLNPEQDQEPGVDLESRETQVVPIPFSANEPGSSLPEQNTHHQMQNLRQPSIADQETREVPAVLGPFSAVNPDAAHYKQKARRSESGDQPSIADQETRETAAVYPLEMSGSSQYTQKNQQQGPLFNLASVVHQDTQPMPSVVAHKTGGNPPGAMRRVLNGVVTRLQNPQPEGLLTRGLQVVKPEARLGSLAALTLITAFGLLVISLFDYLSVEGYPYVVIEATFFSGLLLMFVPNVVRLLSRTPSRQERICLLCVLGLSFYIVQFMVSPFHFSQFDELLHWRTANDILNVGHLFTPNTMLPVSPYYPGLEIVTNAISTTTGLDTFYAGNIVIGVSRILLTLAGFLLFEKIMNSSRMASLATIIYMLNTHFVFYDALYTYETLALPLAIFMVYILARFDASSKNYHWIIGTAWIVLLAVNVTHHMTSYVSDGLLLLWAVISLFRSNSRNTRIHLVSFALFGLSVSLAYAFLLPGNPVWSYLYSYFNSAFQQLGQIIAGASQARPLFSSAGLSAPIWDRLLMTGSAVIITFSLPFGLLVIQRQHRRNTLAVTLGIASLLYPATQIFRFTQFGAEITDRAAAFVFLAIACVLTILMTHFWPTRELNKRTIALLTVTLVVIFLGGILIEAGPGLAVTPGPYRAENDARSIEPQGIDAAIWSLTYLGSGNQIATDRVNQMLMSAYGDQSIVTYLYNHVDVSPIFYSAEFGSSDISILQAGKIRYLEVDLRISTALPLQGIYFDVDQPTQIIGRDGLTKFNTVIQINRLFDSGDIAIYDTGAFLP